MNKFAIIFSFFFTTSLFAKILATPEDIYVKFRAYQDLKQLPDFYNVKSRQDLASFIDKEIADYKSSFASNVDLSKFSLRDNLNQIFNQRMPFGGATPPAPLDIWKFFNLYDFEHPHYTLYLNRNLPTYSRLFSAKLKLARESEIRISRLIDLLQLSEILSISDIPTLFRFINNISIPALDLLVTGNPFNASFSRFTNIHFYQQHVKAIESGFNLGNDVISSGRKVLNSRPQYANIGQFSSPYTPSQLLFHLEALTDIEKELNQSIADKIFPETFIEQGLSSQYLPSYMYFVGQKREAHYLKMESILKIFYHMIKNGFATQNQFLTLYNRGISAFDTMIVLEMVSAYVDFTASKGFEPNNFYQLNKSYPYQIKNYSIPAVIERLNSEQFFRQNIQRWPVGVIRQAKQGFRSPLTPLCEQYIHPLIGLN
jgi:hypothetical protein